MLYLHGVDGDGERGVVPVHLVLLATLLVPHSALVRRPDAEHAQDDHEHQEADAHHDDDGGGAGHHWENSRTSALHFVALHYRHRRITYAKICFCSTQL